jgi:hypothetical protein
MLFRVQRLTGIASAIREAIFGQAEVPKAVGAGFLFAN